MFQELFVYSATEISERLYKKERTNMASRAIPLSKLEDEKQFAYAFF